VFDSTVDGQVLDFGTTGRLRMSDLVMYDRQTESWWQQFTGTGIIGEYTDTVLTQLPSQIVSFASAREAFPTLKVLSKNTGYQRPYGNNPYAGYDSIDSSPFLYRGEVDTPRVLRWYRLRLSKITRLCFSTTMSLLLWSLRRIGQTPRWIKAISQAQGWCRRPQRFTPLWVINH